MTDVRRKVTMLDFTVSKKRLATIALGLVLVLVYKGVLDYAYANVVTDNFLSSGYELKRSEGRVALSYLLAVVTSLLMLVSFDGYKKPSSLVIFILYLFLLMPMLTLFGLAEYPAPFLLSCLGNFVLLIVILKKVPALRLCSFDCGFALLALVLFSLVTLYVYSFFISTGGLGRLNFNFYNVYEVREELSEYSAPLMGYLLSWQANVINMALLSFGFLRGSKAIVVFSAFIQVALFGMTNFKSFLFAPIFVTFIFYFFARRKFVHLLIFGLCSATIIAYLLYLKTGDIMLVSILTRRLFFVPAQLHSWYYEFFSDHTKVMLSNSIFAPFLSYPYEMPLTRVISWEYLGRDGGTNVGMLGDAFAHFGHAGMAAFSVLLGIFLKLIDSFATALPANFCAAVIAIPAMSLINSGLFTTLLTHGFLCAFMLLWLFAGSIKGLDGGRVRRQETSGSADSQGE